MKLHHLTLEDKAWFDPVVMAEDTRSSDFSFASVLIWNDPEDVLIGKLEGRLIVCSKLEGQRFFASPIGSGPIAPAIYAIDELCTREGVPMLILGVTEQNKAQIEQEMPGKLAFEAMTDYADYIYEIDKLVDLSGRKYHSKKNHINKFISLYPDWRYEALRPEHFDSCNKLLEAWQIHNDADQEEDIAKENDAIQRAFRFYDELELEGGVLFAEGRLCAFTVGEKCAKDTMVVHFEKADVNFEGSYTMINREFVRRVRDAHPEIRYINRADDVGLEPLRKAKQSYHPFCLEMKYNATWK